MKQVTTAALLLFAALAIAATTAPGASVAPSVSATLAGTTDCPLVKVQWCWEVSPDPDCPLLGEWCYAFGEQTPRIKGSIALIPIDCEAHEPGEDCGHFQIWLNYCDEGG